MPDLPKLRAKNVDHVYLSDLAQRATVSVDEKGSEARAATAALGAAGGSAGPAPGAETGHGGSAVSVRDS